MRIAGFYDNSCTNGEGWRSVLFVAGCPHKCLGCQNPQTWDYNFGEEIEDTSKYIEKILKNNQAVVAGEIISDFEFSHEVFGEGFYFVKLKVSRLSHSSDIIPLLVSERLIDVSQSHIGQFLEARGQFRSYNKHENNRNHLVLSLFVRELELIDSVENRKPNMIFLF